MVLLNLLNMDKKWTDEKTMDGEIVLLKQKKEKYYVTKFANSLPIISKKEFFSNNNENEFDNLFDSRFYWKKEYQPDYGVFKNYVMDFESGEKQFNSNHHNNVPSGKNKMLVWYPINKKRSDSINDDEITEDEFKKHYKDLLSQVGVNRTTLVVSRIDDRLRITFYHFQKHRQPGTIYFKKRQTTNTITINTKTGDVYLITTTFSDRKRHKTIKKNKFNSLLYSPIFENLTTFTNNNTTKSNTILNEIIEILRKELKITKKFDIDDIVNIGSEERLTLCLIIMEWFITKRGIKTPNNPYNLLFKFYPGLREIKKNKMKLISTYLKIYQINSKKVKELLHINPTTDLNLVSIIYHLLGLDFFNQLTIDEIIKLIRKTDGHTFNLEYFFRDLGIEYPEGYKQHKKIQFNELTNLLNTDEKKCFVKFFKDCAVNDRKFELFCNDVKDHIRFKKRIDESNIDIKIKMKFNDLKSFNDEHRYFSSLVNFLNSNTITNYEYQTDFHKCVEEKMLITPIDLGSNLTHIDLVYPVLLKNCFEYYDEHLVQNHCVHTYLTNHESIIISLRLGSPNSLTRVTCEYRYSNGQFNLIQSKLPHNQIPKDYLWTKSIENLNTRLSNFQNTSKYKKPEVKITQKPIEHSKYHELLEIENEILYP